MTGVIASNSSKRAEDRSIQLHRFINWSNLMSMYKILCWILMYNKNQIPVTRLKLTNFTHKMILIISDKLWLTVPVPGQG